jgi:DNA-binding XRE family transcriptional regulator
MCFLQKLFLRFDNGCPVPYKRAVATPQGPFYVAFGKKLAEARRAAKVTQEALSKSVGLSRTSIVNIEKGRQPVHLQLVAKMATSLGTTVAHLIPDLELLADVHVRPDLKKISQHNRPWVERVISGVVFGKEVDHAPKILSGETQSSGTASSSKGKKGTHSR